MQLSSLLFQQRDCLSQLLHGTALMYLVAYMPYSIMSCSRRS